MPVIVSVECVAFNHGKYIRKCLESIVSQKTTFQFEVVVHDDASTDDTAEVIKEFAEKYPEIIVPILEEENQYSKRDGTIEKIINEKLRGKYTAFCECDDYWTDEYKLQKQVDFLESHQEFSACAHQSEIIGDATGLFRNDVPSVITMQDLVINSRFFHTASMMWRTEIRTSLPIMTQPIVSGDKLMCLQLATYGPIFYMPDVMCVYRKHGTGMSNVVSINNLKSDRNIIEYMRKISSDFPKYRYLSFLYGTFATYAKDVSIARKIWYLIVAFILSFSYFPKNIQDLYNKVKRVSASRK